MPHYYDFEVRWKNYRAFKDTGWLNIRPLTVLIGPNNAGKTSVFSPLLLLNQTITSADGITPLVTRGPVVDMGHFEDIIHNHDINQELSLGVRYHVHALRDGVQDVGSYAPGAFEMAVAQSGRFLDVTLKRLEIFDIFRRPYISFEKRSNDDGYELDSTSLGPLDAPEKAAISQTPPLNFLFDPSDILRSYRRVASNDQETLPPPYSESFSRYLRTIGYALEEIREDLSTISYVGPLRARLQRYYDIEGESIPSVGSTGENVANLIRRNLSGAASRSRELNRWIRLFGFGDRLTIKQLSSALFSLYFESGKPPVRINVADAGFGASQVLPLIVQALVAPEYTLTVAEQPEIHLNPRLQNLLADIFVRMAGSNHRVIVETHSEHLLLRLRRLVAEGEIQASDIAIYFIERDTAGASTVRLIPLNEDGNIPSKEWPNGFFEESLRESLGLARAQAQLS
jgi:predicted ATPase